MNSISALRSPYIRKLLDILYPFDLHCSLCGSERNMGYGLGICGQCEARLYRSNMLEDVCGMECYSMLKHTEETRHMVLSLKFGGKKHYARTLGILAADSFMQLGWRHDVIVPVPLHPRRKRRRGYNQSELIANVIAGLTGIPVMPNMLRRTRNTLPQTGLDNTQRRQNIKGAFIAAENIREYNSILLLDDVLTTGSTMAECARAIMATGAECRGFAISRA